MGMIQTVLAFSGSARKESLNKKALNVVLSGFNPAETSVTLLDLNAFPLPIYNGDDEEAHGLPENAKRLKKIISEHRGLLIAVPEYNSGYPALLKNMFDWTSRAENESEEPLQAYRQCIIALISASPGRYGGARGLAALKTVFQNCGLQVIESTFSLSKAHEAFLPDGGMHDPEQVEQLRAVARALETALIQVVV